MNSVIIKNDQDLNMFADSLDFTYHNPIIEDYEEPPSYPCIATITKNGDIEFDGANYTMLNLEYIEVCDVEPGIEYNEELAGHELAAELLNVATEMYMTPRED